MNNPSSDASKSLIFGKKQLQDQNDEDSYKPENTIKMTLGPNFIPGPYDVICARGKHAFQHSGNRYFRNVVQMATEKYSHATSKLERTIIVSEIVDTIRSKGNGFVRKNERGEWLKCDDVLAREKTGQLFRNSLGTRYKSSVKSKRKRRELTNPGVMDSVENIIFSNPQADLIVKTVTADVTSGILSDHDVFERLCEANKLLLRVFKADPGLSQRFVEATRS
ncbi:MAG: hypothetical protein SGILL_009912 [Bacillariaceae sp.]